MPSPEARPELLYMLACSDNATPAMYVFQQVCSYKNALLHASVQY